MKSKYLLLYLILFSVLLFNASCEKFFAISEPEMEIQSLRIADDYNVECDILIDYNGGDYIEERGVCYWNKDYGENYKHYSDDSDGGLGEFSVIADELEIHETYIFKAYAINKNGTFFSDNQIEHFVNYDSNFNTPCSPDTNKFVFNNHVNYFETSITTGDELDYAIRAYDWTSMYDYGVLKIEFTEAPVTSKYISKSYYGAGDPVKGECYVFGEFANASGRFNSLDGDTVYVKKLSEDNYIISFCSLSLAGSYTSEYDLILKANDNK